MDEQDLDLDFDNIESNVEKKVKAKNRFAQLSEKVINTSKERDEAIAQAKAEADAKAAAERERDFFKDLSANISKYPNAGEYQDKILEKVKSGYATDDAIVAVLAKEGKLNPPSDIKSETKAPEGRPEGGSAPTNMEGTKDIKDMDASEKLDTLKGLSQSDLADALRGIQR